MDLGLTGKRAIVTGGSRGIGKQCALALAKRTPYTPKIYEQTNLNLKEICQYEQC